MDKALLIHLLTEWRDSLDSVVDALDAYPVLKNGRQKVSLCDESLDTWKVKSSIENLIAQLEKPS